MPEKKMKNMIGDTMKRESPNSNDQLLRKEKDSAPISGFSSISQVCNMKAVSADAAATRTMSPATLRPSQTQPGPPHRISIS
mmetsp:Transcript_19943/g.40397  ORF Transcript_19943/g.40397 Transcript_19943/m.40397 type:complete len:82 (-) Transcript_19943:626-871(-)